MQAQTSTTSEPRSREGTFFGKPTLIGVGILILLLSMRGGGGPTYPTVDGGSVSLQSNDGRITIVDVWATWCGPCVASIPTIESIHRDMADDFRVISFAVKPSSTVTPWLDQRRARAAAGQLSPLAVPTYPVAAQDGEMPDIVNQTRGYPTLWILAPNGDVLDQIVGKHDAGVLRDRLLSIKTRT